MHDNRVESACQLANFPSTRAVSDIVENWNMFMQSVSDFVDCLLLGHNHLPILKGLGLEEEPDLVRRLKEVFTESMGRVIVGTSEDSGGLRSRFKAIHELVECADRFVANLRGNEVFDDCIAVLLKMLSSFTNAELERGLHANRNR